MKLNHFSYVDLGKVITLRAHKVNAEAAQRYFTNGFQVCLEIVMVEGEVNALRLRELVPEASKRTQEFSLKTEDKRFLCQVVNRCGIGSGQKKLNNVTPIAHNIST